MKGFSLRSAANKFLFTFLHYLVTTYIREAVLYSCRYIMFLMTNYLFVLAGFLLLPSALLDAQTTVKVDVGSVLRQWDALPIGINLNTLTDGAANRPVGTRPLADAIRQTGTTYLRFPGGEKSDVYQWAAAPYDDPSTSGLSRKGPSDWPSNDERFWDLEADTWANDDYNFDEFMADCIAAGAEPVIVVALDGIYKPPSADGDTSLTREQALEMAVEWVRYANVTNNYAIKYWELGNETWNGTTYAGRHPGFATYGRDVAEFARAMKAVDPSIKIGINGATFSDFDLALRECAAEVDFLDVHAYPAYGFTNYNDYIATNLRPGGIVDVAERAIAAIPDAATRQKLFIVMTETSATGFQLSSDWDNGNNLGQALANFDILAQMIQDPRLRFTQYWNTRWIRPDSGKSHPYDLFTAKNELNASGQMIALIGREMLDAMVDATSEGVVRAFATVNQARDSLTVFLLNKDTRTTNTQIFIDGFAGDKKVARGVFSGDTPLSTDVSFTALPDTSVDLGQVSLALPPTSLTVLRFASPAMAGDYWLEAECATVGSRWMTGTSSQASGGKHVVAPRDISMSSPPDDLEQNRVRFDLSVAAAGSYQFFARINAPTNRKDSYWVRINGGEWYKWYNRIERGVGFNWNRYPKVLSLRAGQNTVDFAFREPGTQLDKLYFTQTKSRPTGLGSAAGNCGTSNVLPVVEAECLQQASDWQRRSSSEASAGSYMVFTGDRNINMPKTAVAAQELRYTVNMSQAGRYFLFMRLDAPDPSSNSVWVRVDDQPWMKFWRETTGEQLLTSGFEWREVNHDGVPGSLDLSAGFHSIRVANREPGTRIDKLLLASNDGSPSGHGPPAEECSAETSMMAAASTTSMDRSPSATDVVPAGQPVVRVFPNPTESRLSVVLRSDYNGLVEIMVYDSHGRRILEKVVEKAGHRLNAEVMVDWLPRGLYQLRLIEGDRSATRTFIRR